MTTVETLEDLKEALNHYGELMVVLESDREYALHPHDTAFNEEDGLVYTEGIPEDADEYMKVEFSPDVVEHYYAHSEL
mgnify:CR=1 FL=1